MENIIKNIDSKEIIDEIKNDRFIKEYYYQLYILNQKAIPEKIILKGSEIIYNYSDSFNATEIKIKEFIKERINQIIERWQTQNQK
jgi:hypothetical protein